jgi:hypothetical protein
MSARLKKIEVQLTEILLDVDQPSFRAAWGDTICGVLKAAAWGAALYSSIRGMHAEPASHDNAAAEWEAEDVRNARSLLGVSVEATPDQIRRALRIKLRDGRLHPDHGGDGVLAKELIAAKNLLIEVAVASGGGA